MEIDKAVEFLLQSQARQESQLQSIRNLIESGIKLVITYQNDTNHRLNALLDAQIRTEEKMGRLEDRMSDLAEAQKKTEQKLQVLIDSFKKPNGNQ